MPLAEDIHRELQEREYRFHSLADQDPLTGALNRRSFFRRAVSELERAYIRKTGVCLAIMVMDHFRQFNERHGPLAGDEALKHTMRVVSGELRKTDFMGRYGGEEFVVFFPATRLEHCRLACQRALKALSAAPVQVESGPAFITVSVGLAETVWNAGLGEGSDCPDFSAEWMLLAARADRALCQAKRSDRARTAGIGGRSQKTGDRK
jgi:diguanylate cyclase (GGDEF)-like protein